MTVVEPSPPARGATRVAEALGARRALRRRVGERRREARARSLRRGATRACCCPAETGRRDRRPDRVPPSGTSARRTTSTASRFAGHEPLRALVAHPRAAAGRRRSRGDGVHQVAVGPIHAGVIESGHFRFHVVGERILHLDLRLFYKHRGLERAAEGRPLEDGTRVRAARVRGLRGRELGRLRACGRGRARAVAEPRLRARADAAARARAPLQPPQRPLRDLRGDRLRARRDGLRRAQGTRPAAQRARSTGHRFLFGTVAVGASPLQLDAHAAHSARARAPRAARRRRRGLARAAVRRLGPGPARRRRRAAARDAAAPRRVGPAARAAGVRHDAREHSPRLWYSGFAPARPPTPPATSPRALRSRAVELQQTCEMLDELLAAPARAAGAAPTPRRAAALGVGRVESPRGATTCVVELSAGRVRACTCAPAPTPTGPRVAHAAAGNLLPDFPLINKSFELCYACADR